MTSYPVDYEYSKDGIFYLGWASTEDEALSLLGDGLEPEDVPTSAHLKTVEAGLLYQKKSDAERDFAEEIDGGYCTIAQVWGGFRANIETWKSNPEEDQ